MTGISNETSKITEIVLEYYDGMALADEDKLRHAFHPDSFIIGNFGGNLEWSSLEAFIDDVKNTAPEHTSREDKDYHIDINSVDVAGDTAVAKVTNNYFGLWFTDYLSLLKLEGRWVIINKLFHHHADHDSTTS